MYPRKGYDHRTDPSPWLKKKNIVERWAKVIGAPIKIRQTNTKIFFLTGNNNNSNNNVPYSDEENWNFDVLLKRVVYGVWLRWPPHGAFHLRCYSHHQHDSWGSILGSYMHSGQYPQSLAISRAIVHYSSRSRHHLLWLHRLSQSVIHSEMRRRNNLSANKSENLMSMKAVLEVNILPSHILLYMRIGSYCYNCKACEMSVDMLASMSIFFFFFPSLHWRTQNQNERTRKIHLLLIQTNLSSNRLWSTNAFLYNHNSKRLSIRNFLVKRISGRNGKEGSQCFFFFFFSLLFPRGRRRCHSPLNWKMKQMVRWWRTIQPKTTQQKGQTVCRPEKDPRHRTHNINTMYYYSITVKIIWIFHIMMLAWHETTRLRDYLTVT